mmetsp:Transcript_58387/g.133644  ORF Transcript_58387/g.133644 Transcript_58387/m.133644 type:complete len:241 (+) Transcript_58387:61-783(+)
MLHPDLRDHVRWVRRGCLLWAGHADPAGHGGFARGVHRANHHHLHPTAFVRHVRDEHRSAEHARRDGVLYFFGHKHRDRPGVGLLQLRRKHPQDRHCLQREPWHRNHLLPGRECRHRLRRRTRGRRDHRQLRTGVWAVLPSRPRPATHHERWDCVAPHHARRGAHPRRDPHHHLLGHVESHGEHHRSFPRGANRDPYRPAAAYLFRPHERRGPVDAHARLRRRFQLLLRQSPCGVSDHAR